MKKTIIIIILVILSTLTLSFGKTKIEYKGQNNISISKEELFNNFKNVFPGDELIQNIEIENKTNEKIKVYIKALSNDNLTNKFLETVELDIVGIVNSKDLNKEKLIASIEANTIKNIVVKLNLPKKLESKFQNSNFSVNWEITFEEILSKTKNLPKTGTDNKIYLYISLVFIVFGLTIIKLRKTGA